MKRTWPGEFKIGKCYCFYYDQKQFSFIVLGVIESEPWDHGTTKRFKAFINGKIKKIICYEWQEFWIMEK